MNISENPFFRQQAYINGQWCDADNKETLTVSDPATGKVIGQIPNMAANEAKKAIQAAYDALPQWQVLTGHQRAQLLQNWFRLLSENKERLAEIMTLEQGKPLVEAEGEITYAALSLKMLILKKR